MLNWILTEHRHRVNFRVPGSSVVARLRVSHATRAGFGNLHRAISVELLPDSGQDWPESGEGMSRRPRRNHTSALKTKVATAAIKADRTLVQLAEQFDVHPNQISTWKDQLLEGATEIFATSSSARPSTPEVHIKGAYCPSPVAGTLELVKPSHGQCGQKRELGGVTIARGDLTSPGPLQKAGYDIITFPSRGSISREFRTGSR